MREGESRSSSPYPVRSGHRSGPGDCQLNQGTHDENQATGQDGDPGSYLALRHARSFFDSRS